MKKHGQRANEISKLRKIDFIKLIKDKEESGLKHLKMVIDTEFAKREKEASRNLNSGYKGDKSSLKKLNQSHDRIDYKGWDDTFSDMQKNLDDARSNVKHANSYLIQSRENINKVDLKSIQSARNHTVSQNSRSSMYNNNLRLGLKNNDDNNYLTQSTAFTTN